MKKVISLILALAMTLCLFACGESDQPQRETDASGRPTVTVGLP